MHVQEIRSIWRSKRILGTRRANPSAGELGIKHKESIVTNEIVRHKYRLFFHMLQHSKLNMFIYLYIFIYILQISKFMYIYIYIYVYRYVKCKISITLIHPSIESLWWALALLLTWLSRHWCDVLHLIVILVIGWPWLTHLLGQCGNLLFNWRSLGFFIYCIYIGIWSDDLIGRDVLFGQDDQRPDILLTGVELQVLRERTHHDQPWVLAELSCSAVSTWNTATTYGLGHKRNYNPPKRGWYLPWWTILRYCTF